MNFVRQMVSLSSQCLTQAVKCMHQTTPRTISTTAINFKGPKGTAPKEQIAKMWYKPKRKILTEDEQFLARMEHAHRNPPPPKKKRKQIFDGSPFLRGVVLKTLIRKPRKPNSGNRKCVLVRLSNGTQRVSYVPGEGHNLQEHNTVLCKIARLRDTPGVRIKCVRGVYDLPHKRKKE